MPWSVASYCSCLFRHCKPAENRTRRCPAEYSVVRGPGREKTRPPQKPFPLFPEQESSDFGLPFFRLLLPDTTPRFPFWKDFRETKNKSILENPKAQLEHANMSSVFLGFSVVLFPVVSKHLSPALVNFILGAPLWDWRTRCPCSITLQMVQPDLTWCGQNYSEPLFRNRISFERLSGDYLNTVWFSPTMISCCEDKIVLVFCSAL